MKNITLLFILFFSKISAQNCVDTLWQERNGLAVIEPEKHPQLNGWLKKDSVSGFTGTGYIVWHGAEYFTSAANGRMTFKVKINTPGKYAFDWRIGISKGTLSTEHNDTWLSITGVDNFWGEKAATATLPASLVKPKPECNNNPTYKCPEGSTVSGYFKIYGAALYSFAWQARTFDNDPHLIYFEKNTEGVISINIAARSSHHMLDRMVIYKIPDVTTPQARNLSVVSVSNCSTVSTQNTLDNQIKISPNPTTDALSVSLDSPCQVALINAQGTVLSMQNWQMGNHTLDISHQPSGIYWLRFMIGNEVIGKKILKIN